MPENNERIGLDDSIKSLTFANKKTMGFKCNYTPAGKRYKTEGDKGRGRVHRGLLEGCEAVPIKE